MADCTESHRPFQHSHRIDEDFVARNPTHRQHSMSPSPLPLGTVRPTPSWTATCHTPPSTCTPSLAHVSPPAPSLHHLKLGHPDKVTQTPPPNPTAHNPQSQIQRPIAPVTHSSPLVPPTDTSYPPLNQKTPIPTTRSQIGRRQLQG
jgi:hypothetical protein